MVNVGTINLTVTSPQQSFAELFTVDEIRRYLAIPVLSPADTDADDELSAYIVAAREQAEILQGRDLVAKQWDLVFDYWPVYEAGPGRLDFRRIELRDGLASVDLFRYTDSDGMVSAMTEGAGYIVDTSKRPGIVLPPYGENWPSFTPWPSSSILIRFTVAPREPVPFLVRQGMKLLISAWFNNKLPFEIGASAIQEYPFAVTNCLSSGALTRFGI